MPPVPPLATTIREILARLDGVVRRSPQDAPPNPRSGSAEASAPPPRDAVPADAAPDTAEAEIGATPAVPTANPDVTPVPSAEAAPAPAETEPAAVAGFIRSAVTSLRVPPVVIGAVAGAVLVGLAVAALVAARRSEPPPAVAPPSAPVAAVERPRALSTEAQIAARRLEAFAAPSTSEIAEAAPPAAGFEMAFRAQPPFDAIDSVLFDTLRQRLKLHGVVPVGRNEICLAEDGRRFACGLMARATLQNHIAGKEPTCERAFLAEDARAEMLEVRCSVDGEDLALHMIRAGFAFPALHAGAHHFEALAEAKARRAGVWAGPYEPALEDRSRDDSRATPFGSTRVRSPSPSEAGTTLPALMKPNGNARPLPRGPEGAGGGVQPPWAKSQ